MGSEISDGDGEYRNIYWKRKGTEDLTIFEIMRFQNSLRCYGDWKEYDKYQSLFKSAGINGEETDTILGQELSRLGIVREGE